MLLKREFDRGWSSGQDDSALRGKRLEPKYDNSPPHRRSKTDILLVGAGIMCATLAVFLKELDPSLKIENPEVLGSRS